MRDRNILIEIGGSFEKGIYIYIDQDDQILKEVVFYFPSL